MSSRFGQRTALSSSQLVSKVLQITHISEMGCSEWSDQNQLIFKSLMHTLLSSYETRESLACRTRDHHMARGFPYFKVQCVKPLNKMCCEIEKESYRLFEIPCLTKTESKQNKTRLSNEKELDNSPIARRISSKPTFEQKRYKNRHALLGKLLKSLQDQVVIKGNPKRNLKAFSVQNEDFRGSRYRGVSKNKGKWQMTLTLNNKRVYKGCFRTEIEAARKYDQLSIQNFGLKAKANLSYTKEEILAIIGDDPVQEEELL
ncbi:unnamed protein product [Moneuplotes crassus]|uniref:AP2/ERF domain-containing protein n=1 Tax=Euplotes crassus TaxID=5936 RepID=A0AAD1U9N1_EUPCR|nr:unnamed protein product [Moneuplotes crassus]